MANQVFPGKRVVQWNWTLTGTKEVNFASAFSKKKEVHDAMSGRPKKRRSSAQHHANSATRVTPGASDGSA
jgi:hypothetical protein